VAANPGARTTPSADESARAADESARAAAAAEETLRERWEQSSLRVRFDQPIERATRLTKATLSWFPVRVWRHFLIANGFLLAAGVSYQALFATFAAIYVAFAIAGIWLGGSEQAVVAVINLINSYIPGLIADSGGLATPDQVQQIAAQNSGVLGWTGIIALGALIWTAIGWVTFSRRAVRDIFGLPPDRRSYFLLKARDLLAATIFGLSLVIGAALGSLGSWALEAIFTLIRITPAPVWTSVGVRTGSIIVGFLVTSAALAGLFRFLCGAQIAWRLIWPGAIIGGIGISIIQLLAGFLLSYTPSNPLLATFAIFIGMLLWFRLMGIMMLVAAAWIAVAAHDRDVALIPPTEAERLAAEHAALLLAAHVRLRTAQDAQARAPWYRAWVAGRAVKDAEEELRQVEASAPPRPRQRTAS
jgi:membrane protein